MNTLYVPSQYPTIQSAVTNSVSNDEIVISDGTYPETVFIQSQNNLIIRSANGTPTTTIIDANGITSGSGIKLNTNVTGTTIKNITIKNCKATGGSAGYGIIGTGSNDTTTVENCICHDNLHDGINISGNTCTIKNNSCYNNSDDGIQVSGNNNNIKNNVCLHNGHFGEHGLDIDGNNNTISYNKCNYNLADGINVHGNKNNISNNQCCNNAIDGIDIDGDNGDRTSTAQNTGNIIDGNFCELNGAEGIENSAISGAGSGNTTPQWAGTLIINNVSRFNGLADYAISKRNTTDAWTQALDLDSQNNVSYDGSEDFSKRPRLDSW